jgi:hypothetical protein
MSSPLLPVHPEGASRFIFLAWSASPGSQRSRSLILPDSDRKLRYCGPIQFTLAGSVAQQQRPVQAADSNHENLGLARFLFFFQLAAFKTEDEKNNWRAWQYQIDMLVSLLEHHETESGFLSLRHAQTVRHTRVQTIVIATLSSKDDKFTVPKKIGKAGLVPGSVHFGPLRNSAVNSKHL